MAALFSLKDMPRTRKWIGNKEERRAVFSEEGGGKRDQCESESLARPENSLFNQCHSVLGKYRETGRWS